MRNVKGSILLPWVKAIKANKTGAYDRYLTEKDKETLSKLILPSSWYDFETYKNCFTAVVDVEAKGALEVCHDWGRAYSDVIMSSVYKRAIKKGDPKAAMDQFTFVYKSMFSFGKVISEFVSDREMIVTIEDFDPHLEAWYYVTRGWLERFIELCLDKKVSSEFLTKSWRGDPATRIKTTWAA